MVTIRVAEKAERAAGTEGGPHPAAYRLRPARVDELRGLLARPDTRLWVDLDRPSAAELETVAHVFGFHPLTLEDCRAPTHEPKVESYDGYVFLIVHAIDLESIDREVTTTDVECFFADRYLVTHHVRKHSSLDQVAARVEADPALLGAGVDRLLHELLDAIVDRYFPAVAAMNARADQLETALLRGRRGDPLPRMLALKAEVTHLKRTVAPEVEVLRKLAARALPVVSSQSAFYFRDVLDHLLRIESEIENLRDELTSLMQVHLGVASYRLAEVMRILTVFSAVLLPLNLIAGIYGMNFRYMPELGSPFGYPVALLAMVAVAASVLAYFRRRRLM